MKKKVFLGLLAGGMMMTACTEHGLDHSNLSDEPIVFTATIADDWNSPATTRAAMQQNASAEVQQLTDGLYLHTVVTPGFDTDRQQHTGGTTRGTKLTNVNDFTEFMVAGYRYGNGTSLSAVNQNFFSLLKVEKNAMQQWKAETSYTWPLSGDALSFYAYWPCEASSPHITVVDQNGPMTLNFTVDGTLANQLDLMTSKAEVEDATTKLTGTIDLPFNHQLTAVKFVLGDAKDVVPGAIKSVAFENIYTTGSLNVGTDIWSCSTRSNLTVDFSDGIATAGGASLIGNDNVLLMIPQSFDNDNQRIKVVVNDGKQDTELYAVLNGTAAWTANTTVTYKITTTELNRLSINSLTFPTAWGSTTYPFKSDYAVDDEVGVYAVDGSGKVIYDNVKYVKTAEGWEKADTRDVFYPATYTFYAYYPYQSALTGAPQVGSTVLSEGNMPTAQEFFAVAISSWTPAAAQNTEDLINKQDLQVGVATSRDATTVNFTTMSHVMGLASVTMGSKTVAKVRYFNKMTSTVKYNTTETESLTAAPCFVTNLPIESDGLYYYIVNGSKTFTADPDNSLKFSSVTATVASGKYANVTVMPTRDYKYRGWIFEYQNSAQTFDVPVTGTYTIECWGAQGGSLPDSNTHPAGGLGGYTAGDINLNPAQVRQLFIYTGQQGLCSTAAEPQQVRTFNGGGMPAAADGMCASGGGATDIRVVGGAYDYNLGVKTRIMVAGGGAGGERKYLAGAAGGLDSYSSRGNGATIATQETGYRLMYGENAENGNTASGAGGGYFGGITGRVIGYEIPSAQTEAYIGYLASSGGSSFISGHDGCKAIDANATTVGKRTVKDNFSPHNEMQEDYDIVSFADGSVFSYGGITYQFTSTVMIDGAGYSWTTEKGSKTGMPKINATTGTDGSENGHTGAGCVRITSQVIE
ncbi:MAG: fimbrillin family protein [Prevotella sp.]|nr:fimbrillin family protein [Prevotella sp.]